MSELSPDRDAFVERLVQNGHYSDRRQALDHAVDLLQEETAVLDDIREGLASIERGEGIALEEAASRLRAKYGFVADR